MPFHRKHVDPIDRAIDDLDRKIATLQRQLREVETTGRAVSPAQSQTNRLSSAPVQVLSNLMKNMLLPAKRAAAPSNPQRQDLFDVTAEPLKELEAEPIAFANKPEPDLFAEASGTLMGASVALETAEVVPSHEKLAHYLGAGSIKSYKPLKHVQRQTRNRFFMWLGLSFAALWIIWFVIR